MAKRKKYYSLKKILQTDAQYYVIFGGRNNGKTYAVHEYGLQRYWEHGEQMAIVRRWQEDFTGKRGESLFNNQVASGNVARITGGEWTDVYYRASRWYLCRYDENGNREQQDRPFAYGFSISAQEHDKSTPYPGIKNIFFDEFLTRTLYLQDEFVLFMNVLSTIIRDKKKDEIRVFMAGNTVNKYCPYFSEMGLTHIKQMKPGTIDVYTYGESGLTVAVEYSDNSVAKENASFFAFDNPKLKMITGNEWEISIYPHLPRKYKPKDIAYMYFIVFDSEILQCEIITFPDMSFTYIHRKTSPLKEDDWDLIYTPDFDPRPNYRRKITKPFSRLEERIASYYAQDKVFFQDNEVGDIVMNYLQFCRRG